MASLATLKAKLAEQENKRTGGGRKGGGDTAMYRFWDIPEGSVATLRFLPDADQSNDFFWKERLVINLPFSGIKGTSNTKEIKVTVPCMVMYGETCPVITQTRSWWNDPELVDIARKYWKKKSYIFQGFVPNSPMEEENTPENPIRRFAINSSIYEIIKSSLMNTDFEDLPCDFQSGRDFNLRKNTKGGYANYTTSSWPLRTRPLGVEELEAIDKYGLFTLNDFLPKKPSSEELEIINEMFKSSVDGDAYDANRFGRFYRPYGVDELSSTTTYSQPSTPIRPNMAAIQTSKVEEADLEDAVSTFEATQSTQVEQATPVSVAPTESKHLKAEELLQKLRNRK